MKDPHACDWSVGWQLPVISPEPYYVMPEIVGEIAEDDDGNPFACVHLCLPALIEPELLAGITAMDEAKGVEPLPEHAADVAYMVHEKLDDLLDGWLARIERDRDHAWRHGTTIPPL